MVVSSSKRARRAGTVRLELRLSRAGRVQLATSGRLRLSLRVRFAGADEPKVVPLGLAGPSDQGRDR